MLDKLSLSNFFIPNISIAEKETKEIMEKFPLQSLANRIIIDDGKKVAQTFNKDDGFNLSLSQTYLIHLQFYLEIFIVKLFDRMISEKEIGAEDIIFKLESWSLLSKKNLPYIRHGIESFFRKDYVSSIHVLVPQFESTLRRMFAAAGYPTTSIKKGTVQHEETFNAFLEREDIKISLGTSVHKLIQMVMVEQTGLNLRNEVAHGLLPFSKCNRSLNILVIFLFLVLTRYRKE